jgi:hypothetical protein
LWAIKELSGSVRCMEFIYQMWMDSGFRSQI